MAKIKFNVKGVESKGEAKVPKPGVYRAVISTCVDAKPSGKDRRLEVQYTIKGGDYDGAVIYDYINLESEAAAWKLRQFLEAVGLVTDKKETGTLDPDAIVGTAITIKTRVQPETEQWPAKATAALLLPLDGDEDDGEDLSEDDGDDSDDDTGDDSDDDSSDDEGDGEDEDEDEELWTEEELTELDDDDLKLYAFGGEDEDGDEVEGLLGEDADEDEYITKKKRGKKTVSVLDRDALIAAMLEAQGDGDDEGDDDGEDAPDYESMELADLKKLAKERKISGTGSKKVIIARLEKDDQPF